MTILKILQMKIMNKILFLDILSTGMDIKRCAIYRIGGIYTEDGVEKKRFDFRVRPFPGARISDQSLWVGGVDRSILAHYPDQEKVFEEFIAMLNEFVEVRNSRDKMYLAGFNTATMDAPFLWQWFNINRNERNRDYFHMQIMDMMTVAGFALMDERRSMQDFKLESVARQLRIYPGEGDTSDCIQNAKTCLDIYRHMRTRFGLEQFDDLSESTDIVKNY